MVRVWEANPAEEFKRRLGKSAFETGDSPLDDDCPDIWELTNGDVAFIGRDMTAAYADRLPPGVRLRHDERIVVLPRTMVVAAKPDIPDA